MTSFAHNELGLAPAEFYREQLAVFRADAARSRRHGDVPREARASLNMGWAEEKLGNGSAGIDLGEQARELFASVGDTAASAECSHSIAVWRFHCTTAPELSRADFVAAATTRTSLGDLLLAAQSWHNKGYVELINGAADEALSSYREADRLLEQLIQGEATDLRSIAKRERGFVLSHMAYWLARHGSADDALDATVAYFDHVAHTGVHREPVLAYLAAGLALALVGESDVEAVPRTMPISSAEHGLRQAVAVAENDLRQVAPGRRRAYLGSHLLALADLASWEALRGREAEASRLMNDAIARSAARGWDGETARLSRRLSELR